jgi:hypothetical protein
LILRLRICASTDSLLWNLRSLIALNLCHWLLSVQSSHHKTMQTN